MNAIRLYFRLIGASFRTQLEYRASFVMLTLANAMNACLEFFTVLAFFSRFGGLPGWTLHEVGLFYGMTTMAFAICEAWMRGFDTFQHMIKRGEFDSVLTRPRSTVLQVLGTNFQLLRGGRFLVSTAVLTYSIAHLSLHWGPTQWALFIASILGGALLFSGLILIQATSCFWTVETLEIFNTVTYGGVETSQYPISIYAEWLKKFFCYIVPLAAINYWPLSALLGRHYVHPALSWLAPIVGPAFYCIGLLFWRFGVKHYRSTGS